MAEIVNLGSRRKRKARAEKDSRARANRAAFGRTKAQKAREQAEADRAGREIDGKKLGDE